jgi:release factor glutamine methyltransferase
MAMITVLEVLQKTTPFLESKGIENGRLNAELLVGHALGLKRMQLYLQFERLLTESELELIRPLVRRRSQREPLQYITGTVEFSDLVLKVDRRALIPRPETEYLAELVKEAHATGSPPATALDLGTGSGALGLALARAWPACRVTAIDYSVEALALATENRDALGLADRVTMIHSDWFSAVPTGSTFDVIVANPPYLTAKEVAESAPEVQRFEPAMALSTAADGMDAIREIVAGAAAHLVPGGWLAMETGIAQHVEIKARLADGGWSEIASRRDLVGRDRYVFARRPRLENAVA